MREYRLYCLRPNGRIKDRHDFLAADDRAALASAEICPDGFGAEIWEGARRLASIGPGRTAQ
ncbi:hypothetical protein HJG53_11115 [Sphingomonas sp. ID1715]|uniref:hypothetical protein n=1 Tax=Sphingomonas sp. ID1715 TaxID=1656898 RepID=UPI001487F402|nr:hypothetical protein [Sphingomonas sp. ID1715]NNM77456.1 hypothetical protein [Sphingomonas sp. ID1715]